jgi:hypothetical protein
MSDLEALRNLAGRWSGPNAVLLPDEPPHASTSTLEITPIVGGKFVQLAYTWAFDGEPQEGVLIVGYEAAENAITAVWLDSWHMGDRAMSLRGQAEDETIVLRGSYAVPEGPTWGWRIELQPDPNQLQITMYNVLPDGSDEMLGVDATYTRA